jgi:hypothetical protein
VNVPLLSVGMSLARAVWVGPPNYEFRYADYRLDVLAAEAHGALGNSGPNSGSGVKAATHAVTLFKRTCSAHGLPAPSPDPGR